MQKTQSKASNVLGAFASVILSIIFVITAFILPLYYSVTGLISPKTITTVVQSIDYVEILKNSDKVNDVATESGIDAEIVDEIIKSREVGKLIRDFSGELTNELMDSNGSLDNVDAAFMQNVVDRHIDDIIPVIKKKTNTTVESKKIKQEINKVIQNSDQQIKEAIAELEPIKETITTYSTVTKTLQITSKWYSVFFLCLFEMLLLGLIYLMRKKNYGGFIWIAVDTAITGVFVSGAAVLVASGLVKELTAEIPGFVGKIALSAVGTISTKLTIALIVCFAVMIASIVACVLLKKMGTKKQIELVSEPAEEIVEQTV